MMATRKDDEQLDRTVEDSFPASDPPATVGVVGPRAARPGRKRRQPSHERDDESRPKGTPTDERHAVETAYHWEDEDHPQQQG